MVTRGIVLGFVRIEFRGTNNVLREFFINNSLPKRVSKPLLMFPYERRKSNKESFNGGLDGFFVSDVLEEPQKYVTCE